MILPILDTHDAHSLEMDRAMSWSDAKKGPFVSAVVRLVSSHSVTVSTLPVDLLRIPGHVNKDSGAM